MSLEVLLGHEGAREAVMTALALPAPLGKLLVQYIALFRPAKRQLSFDRVARLLGELATMIEAGTVERSGRAWPAPQDYWRAALEDMLARRDRLTLPLTSHGYLLEILVGLSNRAEAKAETRRETERAYAHAGQRNTAGPVRVTETAQRAPMPPETRASIDKMLRRTRDGAAE